MSKGNLQNVDGKFYNLMGRTSWLRWILYLVSFLSCSTLRNKKVYCNNAVLKNGNPRARGGNNRNNIKAS